MKLWIRSSCTALAMAEYKIQNDVLAVDIRFEDAKGYTKEWNINGETVTLGVEKQ